MPPRSEVTREARGHLIQVNAWIEVTQNSKIMPYLAMIRPIRPSAVVSVMIEVAKDDISRQLTYSNLQLLQQSMT
jgi:hypothetical protein